MRRPGYRHCSRPVRGPEAKPASTSLTARTASRVAVDGTALTNPWTGMGTYSRELLRAMADARPKASITVYGEFAGAAATLRAGRGIKEESIPATRFVGRHLLWPARVNRAHPDVFFGINGHLPLGRLLVPSVITVHDLAIYRDPNWFPGRQPLSTRVIVPRSLGGATAIIAISQHTARDLGELFDVPTEKVTVVPSGVSDSYRPIEHDRLAGVKDELQLPERFVLFVGTIEPRKNVDSLVRAWAGLSPRPPLVIAGGYGWRYENTQRLIAGFGEEIRVLGPVSADLLPPLYNLASCLVHPAWYEGFGLTVLEAMACGTPVLCSDSSSLPEVVGEAALMFPPGDVEVIRRELERVLDDPQLVAQLRSAGLQRARSFSWESTAQGTWQVLDRAADR